MEGFHWLEKDLGRQDEGEAKKLPVKKEGHGQRGTSQPAITASLVVWT